MTKRKNQNSFLLFKTTLTKQETNPDGTKRNLVTRKPETIHLIRTELNRYASNTNYDRYQKRLDRGRKTGSHGDRKLVDRGREKADPLPNLNPIYQISPF